MSVTPEDFEREALPQLSFLEALQKVYGGVVTSWDKEEETLQLTTGELKFVMERDGELHITRLKDNEVFFLSDPTLEDVHHMVKVVQE